MISDQILQSFAGRNTVITGGSGLIGREVTRILCEAGANVRSVSLDTIAVHPKADHVIGDLSDFRFCKEITQDMDFVFHIAGIKGSVEAVKTKPANFLVPLLMMNTNLLEAARLNKARKVVYTSTIGAYSNAEIFREDEYDIGQPPMDFPAWAKRMAEMQVQAYHTQYGLDNFAVVRPCNVYGPGDSFKPETAMVIPTLLTRIANREDPVVIWGDGSAVRDFAYSTDVAKGIILALYHGTRGQFVNLGSGIGHTIKELVETIHSFVEFNYVFDVTKPTGYPRRIMDISRAREWIGYSPEVSLREGVEKTWTWFLANRDEYLGRQDYLRD